MIRHAVLALLVVSCAWPDSVRTGVGHRQESFAGDSGILHDDYTGQQFWIETEWHLSPRRTSIDAGPEFRLFLSELAHHQPRSDKVEITVEGDAPKKGILEDATDSATKLIDKTKNPDGTFSTEGVIIGGLAFAFILVIVYLFKRGKQ